MSSPSEEETRVAFGRRVAECREAAEITQQSFAEHLGAAVKWVQEVEGGRQNVTLSSITRIANGLGVSVSELFETPTTGPRSPGRPRGR